MEEERKNSNTIVPAPLGIEPNTIKYQSGTTWDTPFRHFHQCFVVTASRYWPSESSTLVPEYPSEVSFK